MAELGLVMDGKDVLRSRLNPRKDAPEQGAEKGGPMQILVVEDHADTLRMLELFLHALGHQTDLARNVREALALAASAEKGFDLLLSDLQLPDGDGWELLWRLRKADREPKRAIVLSGWGSEQDVAKSKRAGYQVHLVKPATAGILKAALAEAAEAIIASGVSSQ